MAKHRQPAACHSRRPDPRRVPVRLIWPGPDRTRFPSFGHDTPRERTFRTRALSPRRLLGLALTAFIAFSGLDAVAAMPCRHGRRATGCQGSAPPTRRGIWIFCPSKCTERPARTHRGRPAQNCHLLKDAGIALLLPTAIQMRNSPAGRRSNDPPPVWGAAAGIPDHHIRPHPRARQADPAHGARATSHKRGIAIDGLAQGASLSPLHGVASQHS